MKNNNFSKKDEKFLKFYAETLDPVFAYRRAYSCFDKTDNAVTKLAFKLLSKKLFIEKLKDAKVLNGKDILTQWSSIAVADPNELVQVRRTCCRHCHGVNHEKQMTPQEHAAAIGKAIAQGYSKGSVPAPPGGYNYNATLDPHPRCPVCYGEGIVNLHIADTRKLSGIAKYLYAGAKKKKDGSIEILFHDQKDARKNLANYLGLLKNTIQLTNDSETGQMYEAFENATDETDGSKVYQKIVMRK